MLCVVECDVLYWLHALLVVKVRYPVLKYRCFCGLVKLWLHVKVKYLLIKVKQKNARKKNETNFFFLALFNIKIINLHVDAVSICLLRHYTTILLVSLPFGYYHQYNDRSAENISPKVPLFVVAVGLSSQLDHHGYFFGI
jgi:hypothetical protein